MWLALIIIIIITHNLSNNKKWTLLSKSTNDKKSLTQMKIYNLGPRFMTLDKFY
jgi:hypothetical protein